MIAAVPRVNLYSTGLLFSPVMLRNSRLVQADTAPKSLGVPRHHEQPLADTERVGREIGVENFSRAAASGGSTLAGGARRDEAISYEHERITP
jgi:hypothetical protein